MWATSDTKSLKMWPEWNSERSALDENQCHRPGRSQSNLVCPTSSGAQISAPDSCEEESGETAAVLHSDFGLACPTPAVNCPYNVHTRSAPRPALPRSASQRYAHVSPRPMAARGVQGPRCSTARPAKARRSSSRHRGRRSGPHSAAGPPLTGGCKLVSTESSVHDGTACFPQGHRTHSF